MCDSDDSNVAVRSELEQAVRKNQKSRTTSKKCKRRGRGLKSLRWEWKRKACRLLVRRAYGRVRSRVVCNGSARVCRCRSSALAHGAALGVAEAAHEARVLLVLLLGERVALCRLDARHLTRRRLRERAAVHAARLGGHRHAVVQSARVQRRDGAQLGLVHRKLDRVRRRLRAQVVHARLQAL